VNNPLDIKGNDEDALDFVPDVYRFRFRRFWTLLVQLMLSSPNACLIIASVSVALSPRFAQNLTLFLCWIHREITLGQKHDSK
jgi:hypothetical protein